MTLLKRMRVSDLYSRFDLAVVAIFLHSLGVSTLGLVFDSEHIDVFRLRAYRDVSEQ